MQNIITNNLHKDNSTKKNISYITYQNKKFIVEGDKRSGFHVYEMINNRKYTRGKCHEVETARQAVIYIERNFYCAYY